MTGLLLGKQARSEIRKVSDTASWIWQKGWAERNGGNISVNLTGLVRVPRELDGYEHIPVRGYPKGSAGMVFFVKRTGERLRDMVRPGKGGAVVRMDERARGYHVLWEGKGPGGPGATSEFISHVLIHRDRVQGGSGHRAVVHTHPTELIALSHNPDYNRDEKKLNRVLWSMLPEVRAHMPRGIAITPYTMPGSKKLALLTLKGLRRRDVVIWNKHGATASGKDAPAAFDYIDVANKGAAVLLRCLASRFEPEGIGEREMKRFEKEFGL
jgi:rhamnulose-1-phosphate aldolase